MPFSNARGEMYPFVDYTHNPIKGACWNILYGWGCRYCAIGIKQLGRGQYEGPLILHPRELKEQYKAGKQYFIGSATDMWHPNVDDDDISRILSNCSLWQRQCPASLQPPKFLFQSKCPARFSRFIGEIPHASMLATTYETDDLGLYGDTSRAPNPHQRLLAMANLCGEGYPLMLSIEPVMKFKDVDSFVDQVADMPWALISIGADSCDCIAREKQPDADFVTNLAMRLSECRSVGNVVIKSNCVYLTNNGGTFGYLRTWTANGWIYKRPSEKSDGLKQGVFL